MELGCLHYGQTGQLNPLFHTFPEKFTELGGSMAKMLIGRCLIQVFLVLLTVDAQHEIKFIPN